MSRPTERPADFVDDLSVVPTPDTLWFVVNRDKVLLTWAGTLPSTFDPQHALPLGRYAGRPVFAVPFADEAPEGTEWVSLRQCFGLLTDELSGLAGLAVQLVEFGRTHQFCGVCGTPTAPASGGRSRACPKCGQTVYPRVAPAVIMLIWRGQETDTEFLLAHGPRQAAGMFTTLAGFLEPSETLEAAVRREVLEEVGVRVQNVHYQFSQPWPFPHSLMLAFRAEYAGGEIVPQAGEIEEAHWFSVLNLPQLPPAFTASRRLIDEYLREPKL